MDKKLLIQIINVLAVKISNWCQAHLTKKEVSDVVGWLVIAVISLSLGLICILLVSPTTKPSSSTPYQISGKNVQINNIKGNKQMNIYYYNSSSSPNIKNFPLKK